MKLGRCIVKTVQLSCQVATPTKAAKEEGPEALGALCERGRVRKHVRPVRPPNDDGSAVNVIE